MTVTQRFYNRFRRTSFSSTLRAGLGLTGGDQAGKLIAFPAGGPQRGPRVDDEETEKTEPNQKQEVSR